MTTAKPKRTKPQEIVVNACFGGYGLSDEAIAKLNELGVKAGSWGDRGIKRNNPKLVQVVKELGASASGDFANLQIVKVPAGVKWEIEEYDGQEWVAEKHRTWYPTAGEF